MVKYYLVGGCVRDKFLGINSKDHDFAVECDSYEQMKEDLIFKGIEVFQEKPEFLTIRGRHPKYGGVDYVCCRSESGYSDGRHPDKVEIGDIYSDLSRRDVTVNSIAVCDETGETIDPYDGIGDIKRKVLRAVGDPNERIKEDPLRVFRILRFCVTKGFNIHFDTGLAMVNKEVDYSGVSAERIYEELKLAFEKDWIKTLEKIKCFNLNRILLEKGIKLTVKL